jgi:hypothetical protein
MNGSADSVAAALPRTVQPSPTTEAPMSVQAEPREGQVGGIGRAPAPEAVARSESADPPVAGSVPVGRQRGVRSKPRGLHIRCRGDEWRWRPARPLGGRAASETQRRYDATSHLRPGTGSPPGTREKAGAGRVHAGAAHGRPGRGRGGRRETTPRPPPPTERGRGSPPCLSAVRSLRPPRRRARAAPAARRPPTRTGQPLGPPRSVLHATLFATSDFLETALAPFPL